MLEWFIILQEIYEALCKLDETEDCFVLEASTAVAARLHECTAKLLAHPLQRPKQQDIEYSIAKRESSDEETRPEWRNHKPLIKYVNTDLCSKNGIITGHDTITNSTWRDLQTNFVPPSKLWASGVYPCTVTCCWHCTTERVRWKEIEIINCRKHAISMIADDKLFHVTLCVSTYDMYYTGRQAWPRTC